MYNLAQTTYIPPGSQAEMPNTLQCSWFCLSLTQSPASRVQMRSICLQVNAQQSTVELSLPASLTG